MSRTDKSKILKKKQQREIAKLAAPVVLRFIGELKAVEMRTGDICLDSNTGTPKLKTDSGLVDLGGWIWWTKK